VDQRDVIDPQTSLDPTVKTLLVACAPGHETQRLLRMDLVKTLRHTEDFGNDPDFRYERGFSDNEATFINTNITNVEADRIDTRPDQLILSLSVAF
jgi:hypothetical protein